MSLRYINNGKRKKSSKKHQNKTLQREKEQIDYKEESPISKTFNNSFEEDDDDEVTSQGKLKKLISRSLQKDSSKVYSLLQDFNSRELSENIEQLKATFVASGTLIPNDEIDADELAERFNKRIADISRNKILSKIDHSVKYETVEDA